MIVRNDSCDLAVSKAGVRAGKAESSVVARLHTAAIGSQQDSLRIAWINQDVIHDHVSLSDALPGATCVGGLPQSFGCSGVNDVGI